MRCIRYDLILSHDTVHYAVIDQQLVLVQIKNILVIIVVLSKNECNRVLNACKVHPGIRYSKTLLVLRHT